MVAALRTDADFAAQVASASLPAAVKVYADWCGPCADLAPRVEYLASEFSGLVDFYECPIETWKWLPAGRAHRVKALPTLFLFTGGRLVERVEGSVSLEVLADGLGRLISLREAV